MANDVRLVNANVLKDKLYDKMDKYDEYDPDQRVIIGGLITADELVDDTPTVDAVPVVHAKWEDVSKYSHEAIYATCSACKDRRRREWKYDKNNIQQVNENFCPNCGAKMNLEG